MSDHSDEEDDFHPTTQEDIAVLNMAIANTDTLVSQRLAAYSGSSAAAFTYEWLSQNSEVLWLKRKLQLDFNEHPDRLYRAVNFIDTWAVDPDIISDWTLKQAPFWAPKAGKTQRHQALLLCYSKNCSEIVPPGDTGYIYSCAIVWTLHNQVRVMVPEAIHHIKTTAEGRGKGITTICSLPEHPPYCPSPDDTSVCNLVLLDGSISTWAAPLGNLRVYHAITHYKDVTMRTFIALNQGTSGRLDVKSDELAFYHMVPRGSLWPGETYMSVSNEGDLAPALNTIPVHTPEEEDELPKPDDKSPAPNSTDDAPLVSTVGNEPDRVVFVGPAQFQMADALAPGSPEEQRDTTLDETTPPSTACEIEGDYMMNTLGATSPDDNDRSVLKKTKSKKEKDLDKPKTEANDPSSSDSDSFDGGPPVALAVVQEICDSIERSATIKKIHSLLRKKDFFFILEICDRHKLPMDHINQDDMTGFLQEVGDH